MATKNKSTGTCEIPVTIPITVSRYEDEYQAIDYSREQRLVLSFLESDREELAALLRCLADTIELGPEAAEAHDALHAKRA